jgi:hypothetical protein
MIRFFRRRQALDDFIEAIRPELTAIPTPPATDGLKARIIASRAAGVRHILPVPEARRRLPILRAAGLGIAAALVVLLIPIQLRRSTNVGDDIASPGVFGNVAFAQAPGKGARPALVPVHATAVNKFRALSLEVERRVVDSAGRNVGTGRISLQVSAASIGNRAAWRVISITRDPLPTPHVEIESVYVAKSDLRLLRRDVHVSPYSRFQRINVAQQFRGDSIVGRMTTDGPSIGAGRAFARQLPRAFAPFMTESLAPLFFMAVPLGPDWVGSASLLGWAVRDNDVLLPVELRVESAETITVPAGRFDCWRLSVRVSGKQIHYWVRQTDGLGVRVLDDADATTRGTREIVATRIQ